MIVGRYEVRESDMLFCIAMSIVVTGIVVALIVATSLIRS